MKIFLVLLLVGLVSCDLEGHLSGDGIDPCAIKGFMGSDVSDSIGGSLGSSSKSSLLSSHTSSLFGQDIPPAIADTTPITGLGGTYGGGYPSGSDISSSLASGYSDPALCVRHRLVSRVRPVVEEHYHNVPVLRNYVSNRQEFVTRHVPVVTKHLSSAEDKKIRNVPVLKKSIRTVFDQETQHIPIVRKRVVPVVESYTKHVPVTRCYTRALVDSDRSNVPIVERRVRPVITQRVRHVPVTERRYRPVVETRVVSVPIKQQVVRNLMERRIHTTHEPCDYPYRGLTSPYGYSFYPSGGYSSYITPSVSSVTPVSTYDDLSGRPTITTGSLVSQPQHVHTGCTCFC